MDNKNIKNKCLGSFFVVGHYLIIIKNILLIMIIMISIIMMKSIKIIKLFYEQKKKGAACRMYKITLLYHILLYHIYDMVMLVEVKFVLPVLEV